MADLDVEAVLSKLNLAQKCSLLSGANLWHTTSIPELGIPALRVSDGPNGVRPVKPMSKVRGACFPCGTALGATFDKDLLFEAGHKMGQEAKLKGAHVILGPTVNIQRSPLGGRGFESFSEDPVLSGLAASSVIQGIQSTGVQACLKHFVCNDQEHRRNAMQAMLSDRALREIYALPFQIAVRDADPGSIMTAYNGVNGIYCSENKSLLQGLLRDEWGWQGMVMSDWFGTYSTIDAAAAGLDLEMPGPSKFRGELLRFNVSTDKMWEHDLDERVRTVLKFIKRCAKSGIPEDAPEESGDTPETKELLRRIGTDSLVLMKNEGNVLPFNKNKKTLVVGPNAKVAVYHGGGSASLPAYSAVSPFEGIRQALTTEPEFTIGCQADKVLPLLNDLVTLDGQDGLHLRVYNEPPTDAERIAVAELPLPESKAVLFGYKNEKLKSNIWYGDIEASFTPGEDGDFEFGVVVVGLAKLYIDGTLIVDNATEQRQGELYFGAATLEERQSIFLRKGQQYALKLEFTSGPATKLKNGVDLGYGGFRLGGQLVTDAKEEIEKAAKMAREADQVIICAGLNSAWESEGFDRSTMDLPCLMDDMIAAVSGANPNTVVVMQSGTPVTMPWIDSVPAVVQAWYGGNETGNAIADVLFGNVNPSGKSPLSFPKHIKHNPAYLNYTAEFGRTIYGEDIYVGYRYYEMVDRAVLFPFGHGLSYTSFKFSDLSVTSDEQNVKVMVNVTNTGKVFGKEVVQVYVRTTFDTVVKRPVKELKGFAKVQVAPGETRQVSVEFQLKYGGGFFDESRNKWCVEKGSYEVIASNSSEIRKDNSLVGTFEVAKTFFWSKL